MTEQNNSKFHAMTYNFVAKRLREAYDTTRDHPGNVNKVMQLAHNATLSDLAVEFAKKFAEDNPRFDPIMFLDACSPDTELYPFSELWENRES